MNIYVSYLNKTPQWFPKDEFNKYFDEVYHNSQGNTKNIEKEFFKVQRAFKKDNNIQNLKINFRKWLWCFPRVSVSFENDNKIRPDFFFKPVKGPCIGISSISPPISYHQVLHARSFKRYGIELNYFVPRFDTLNFHDRKNLYKCKTYSIGWRKHNFNNENYTYKELKLCNLPSIDSFLKSISINHISHEVSSSTPQILKNNVNDYFNVFTESNILKKNNDLGFGVIVGLDKFDINPYIKYKYSVSKKIHTNTLGYFGIGSILSMHQLPLTERFFLGKSRLFHGIPKNRFSSRSGDLLLGSDFYIAGDIEQQIPITKYMNFNLFLNSACSLLSRSDNASQFNPEFNYLISFGTSLKFNFSKFKFETCLNIPFYLSKGLRFQTLQILFNNE